MLGGLFFDVRLTRCLLSLLQFDVRLTPCFLSLVRVDYRSNQADDYYESRENHGDDLDAPPVIHLFSFSSCITRHWLGIVFGSQLALKAIQGREDETRQLGILPKESAWDRHEFATGDGAYGSKH